jgi:putative FmdB family regulatory protein
MPLYDYRCRGCRHEFEVLVRPADTELPTCPLCRGCDVERLLSTFAVSSAEKTRAAAKKSRQKAAASAQRDEVAKDIEAENHRREDY